MEMSIILLMVHQLVTFNGMDCREVRPDIFVCSNYEYKCQVDHRGSYCASEKDFKLLEEKK